MSDDDASRTRQAPLPGDLEASLEHAEACQAALLAAPSSRFGWPGRVVKRLVRRLLRFQLSPQLSFNASALQAVKATERTLDVCAKQLSDVSVALNSQTTRIEAIERHLSDSARDLDKRIGTIENDAIRALAERLTAVESHLPTLTNDVGARIDTIENDAIRPLANRLDSIERHLPNLSRDLEADFASLRSALHAQGGQLDEVAGELVATSADIQGLGEEWADAKEEQGTVQERVRTLERRFEPLTTLDHFDFARRYRGDPDNIQERLRRYAQIFGPVERVFDFGCGRGEFLEVCGELEIGAYGVDSDPDMVSHCKLKRVDVVLGDALEHLRNLPSRHLDGFFSAQVVEHLTPAELVELVELASEKLKRGGKLVIETINPNTFSALRWFFLDPTHCQPVPAEMLRFFLEEANFQVLDIQYASPVPEDERLTFLKQETHFDDPAVADLSRVINENSRRLNEAIFGFQDYAIIAER